jgi:hypothetical protein
MPDGGASIFATLASVFSTTGATAAGATAAGTAAASTAAAGTAAAIGATAGEAALISSATAAAGVGGGAAAGGLSALGAIEAASAVAGLGGTAAQLLADKPKAPNMATPATRDEAQREADMRSELYRRRGRAAALLTPGGAKGDTSAASLGAASLLGG